MIGLTEIRALDLLERIPDTEAFHISAASGLVCIGSTAYVVADDELYLGVFSTTGSEPGQLIRLFDGALPDAKAERKRQKPDLEALTQLPASRDFPHGALLAVGSGSRANRCRGVLLGLDPGGTVSGSPQELDLSPIFAPLYYAFAELNIEGAVVISGELRLFHRGNKRHPDNAIIRYPWAQVVDVMRGGPAGPIKPSAINRLDLGLIEGVPLCFTDAAALPNGDMVFSAVAEDTEDAYLDGPCVGAAIGIVDNDGNLVSIERLNRPYKVEGISVRQQHGDRLDLLLATDADDRAIPALLLSTSIGATRR